jgi:hypothetical protein
VGGNLVNFQVVLFQIILSNPIETPKIADFGFLVSPGVEARFAILPEIREATPSLRDVDVEKRQCFFQDERPLRYFRYISPTLGSKEIISLNLEATLNGIAD